MTRAICLLGLTLAHGAYAETATSTAADPAATNAAPAAEAPAPAAAAAAPAPYSIPWGLRPVTAGNVLRLDWALAVSDNPAAVESLPVIALASYKVMPDLAVLLRVGTITNSPKLGGGATAITNPALGGVYSLGLRPDLKLGLFLGLTLPVGSGGGNSPDPAARQAVVSGILARSAMDNALFATNYMTIFPGVGAAYIAHGLTVQAETTLLLLFRTRGDQVDKDASRINWTAGLHLGYFLRKELAASVELRYQRWLKNDTVSAVADNPATDNLSLAFGFRGAFQVGNRWIRPGVSFAVGVDDPLGIGDKGFAYKIIQVDIPFAF